MRQFSRSVFQSLNWDGVISNGHLPCQSCDFVFVSIPQLGWGDFKQLVRVMGSIAPGFQSLNWDGVISNFGSGVSDSLLEMFQSLNWDGVISNWQGGALLNRNGRHVYADVRGKLNEQKRKQALVNRCHLPLRKLTTAPTWLLHF